MNLLLKQLTFALCFFMSLPVSAQWDWENPEKSDDTKKESNGSVTRNQLFSEENLKERVLFDIRNADDIVNRNAYASDVNRLLVNVFDRGEIISDWNYWDSTLNSIILEVLSFYEYTGEYSIFIIDDPYCNVYAVDGGLFFITAGMLAEVQSIDELRFIIAHEFGHVLSGHAYSDYVRKTNAETMNDIATIGLAAFTGVVWITHPSRKSVFNERYYYKEEEELIADDLAMKYMIESRHSIQGGINFYKHQLAIKNDLTYVTGKDPKLYFYCADHPQIDQRLESLMDRQLPEESALVDESFETESKKARFWKVYRLIEIESYRWAINRGMSYLNENEDNTDYSTLLLKALEAARNTFSINYSLGNIFYSGYKVSDSIEAEVYQENIDNPEVIRFVNSVLHKTSNTIDFEYPINLTFSQLADSIRKDLGLLDGLEDDFRRHIRNENLSSEYLAEYISSGGVYRTYAEHLQDPDEFYLYRTISLPVILERQVAFSNWDYQKCFEYSDWTVLTKEMRVQNPELDFVSIEDISDTLVTRELKSLNSLFSFSIGNHETTLPPGFLHPSVMNWACENNAGQLILIMYLEKSQAGLAQPVRHIQILQFDLNSNVVTQAYYRQSLVGKRNEEFIPKKILATYKGLLRQTPRPYKP